MKTTLDLPDDLFVEAKAVAVQRRITLKTNTFKDWSIALNTKGVSPFSPGLA